MILDKNEIDERLASPNNLLNRLRMLTGGNKKDIVSIPRAVFNDSKSAETHPSLPPDIDKLVEDVEDKVNTAKCYSSAKSVLAISLESLKSRIIEVDSPAQLSKIALDMGRIVSDFDANKNASTDRTIPIIYRPVIMTENNFQTIMVNE